MNSTKSDSARPELPFIVAGSGKGARRNLPALARWNERSTNTALRLLFIDPVPGRAEIVRAEANELGVPADAHEGTIEGFLAGHGSDGQPIISAVDRPETIALLALESDVRSPLLGFLLAKLPDGQLWGLRFFIRANDLEARRQLVKFCTLLGQFTARRGSAAVVGADATAEHRLSEPLYRRWYGDFCEENITKLVAHTEPSGYAFEITDDGKTTFALFLREGETWADPAVLAAEVVDDPPEPILRGESFVVGELTPAGIRFHKVRRRKRDDRFALVGLGALDEDSIETERRTREAATALERAERQTISRGNAVVTTD